MVSVSAAAPIPGRGPRVRPLRPVAPGALRELEPEVPGAGADPITATATRPIALIAEPRREGRATAIAAATIAAPSTIPTGSRRPGGEVHARGMAVLRNAAMPPLR